MTESAAKRSPAQVGRKKKNMKKGERIIRSAVSILGRFIIKLYSHTDIIVK